MKKNIIQKIKSKFYDLETGNRMMEIGYMGGSLDDMADYQAYRIKKKRMVIG